MLDESGLAGSFSPTLRIGIKVDVDSVALSGDADVLASDGSVIGQIQGAYELAVRDGGISISGMKFGRGPIRLRSSLLPLKVGTTMLRGEVEVFLENGRLTVVNELGIEDYVRGVINKEAIPSWPLEAKKTQAVLARTFAVYQKMFNPRSRLFDLAPSVLDQVYGGLGREDLSSNRAVDETKGEVITIGSNPAKIYFHSTCGGTISSSAEVWGKDEPHLKEKACPYCRKSSLYRWTRKLDAADVAKKLAPAGISGGIKSIKAERGRTRVKNVVVNGRKIPVNKFRELVGFSVVWSNDFTVQKNGNTLIFQGKGAGHGVGVCQWGMAGMAAQGKDHREILKFYLSGIEIRKMY
ncbi:SpoIID/LytB domain-containing protein [bacterium]|nr:SpoIID/LytB domain-containing protein [bacterium]